MVDWQAKKETVIQGDRGQTKRQESDSELSWEERDSFKGNRRTSPQYPRYNRETKIRTGKYPGHLAKCQSLAM